MLVWNMGMCHPVPNPLVCHVHDANAGTGFAAVNVGAQTRSTGSATLAQRQGTTPQALAAISRVVVIRLFQLQTGPSAEVVA